MLLHKYDVTDLEVFNKHDRSGDELLAEFLRYGISAISLKSTGSRQEGIRVCTSKISESEYAVLDERLRIFDANNK